MKLAELLSHVGAAPPESVSLPSEETANRPWYVRAVVAITIWIGALCLAGFLMALDLLREPAAQLVVGAAMLATSILAARFMRGLARLHVVLIGYVAASGALIAFVDKGLRFDDESTLFTTAILQVVFMCVIASRVVRFKAAMAAIMAMWAFVLEERIRGGVDILVVALAAIAVLSWCFDTQLAKGKLGRIARAVSFATPLALLFIQVASLIGDREMRLAGPAFVTLCLTAMLLFVIARANEEAAGGRASTVMGVAIIGAIVLALFTWRVPGVMGAAVVIALGRMRKEPILEVLGSAGLAVFLFFLYRSLELTLLTKAAAITGAGVMILILREVALRVSVPSTDNRPAPGTSVLSPVLSQPPRGLWKIALPTILVVGVTLGLVAHKESLIAHGRTVYLELAPLDPRSLMQGDYMVLTYAAASEVARKQVRGGGAASFAVDDRGVARFDENGDVLIKYRTRAYGRVTFGAESFFFPEGKADAFASARYAELRVDDDGDAVLVGLRDVELRTLE